MEVEEHLIRRGLVKEVLTIFKLFYFVEFKFDEIVDCLDVRLHSVGAGENSLMTLAG